MISAALFVAVAAVGIYLALPKEEKGYVPKPRAYHRVVLEESSYERYRAACPFEFDYSTQAVVVKNPRHMNSFCWINVHYPQYNATVHLTYNTLEKGLHQLAEESRSLALKHISMANDINEALIESDSADVHGVIYNFEGSTATNFQFYLTDSNSHFLRGALYFNMTPNPDSLAPVVEHVEKDIYKMLETFTWTDKKSPSRKKA